MTRAYTDASNGREFHDEESKCWDIYPPHMDISKGDRASLKKQKPCVLWLTGLSGAGKTTLSNLVEIKLFKLGYHTYVLDGDNVRDGLNCDLGFTEPERAENMRRVGEVAKLMCDAGLIVLCAFVSPLRLERKKLRDFFQPNEFFEIFVDCPLATVEARDTKGLYKKARIGDLANFTGVNAPYEVPTTPDLHLKTEVYSPDYVSGQLMQFLKETGLI
ncbi:Bifunctional enzyme NodQ [Pseudomonas syringae group genomosp. 3]|uniref:Adenylyl-sulfate kinase n=1 Tax=Pseudomonas syringae group genomosp. 3 TaxID=251701 RepID=A0A2K4WAY6_9PSED|nr:adenylyl-sulfate kinase [Pseudomonas syringae group genomosp. 3]SOS33024.1 Bifunctional enzyme NodQ [Pseudomonas syringae group genomosp. 3]